MSNSGEVFAGGATTSQHVDAQDDDHFENTTFKLKRTRSLGLLDEFILPPTEALQEESADNYHELDPLSDDSLPSSSAAPPDFPATGQSSMSSTESEESEASNPEAIFDSPDLLPHDDTDLTSEPVHHVDYLSHKWDVSDISKSWRYVISKRKDVANSARLENASWRTWAQRRSNLKTINPEVLNWSKDNDVTWLYGPILKDDDGLDHDDKSPSLSASHHGPSTATSKSAGDISIPNKSRTAAPKPILKRRTLEATIISHTNLLKLQLATNKLYQHEKQIHLQQQQQRDKSPPQLYDKRPEFDDYDAISAKLNSQYKQGTNSQSNSIVNLQNLLNKQNSSSNLAAVKNSIKNEQSAKAGQSGFGSTTINEASQNTSIDGLAKNTEDAGQHLVEDEPIIPPADRHIHFNDEVQQCIIVDDYEDNDEYDDDDDDYYDDEDEEEDYYYQEPAEESYIYDETSGQQYGQGSIYSSDQEADEEEDDDGGFFLNVKSLNTPLTTVPGLSGSNKVDNDDAASTTTSSSRVSRSLEMLPPTTLNYGSSDEESDEENPYTSSLSHNVNNNSRRGYDYYYDYNTVYTVDPNHAIYGSNKKEPDVVDVPENITIGSSFDYDNIEDGYNSPIVNQQNPPVQQSPFQLEDSDSSDDSDTGLSINTRTSLQSLAQQVFGHNGMTPTEDTHNLNHPQPVSAPVSSINPNHSSTSISKQPHSSSSLSDQFFGGASTNTSKKLTSSLSSQFFDQPRTESPPQSTFSGSPDTSLQNFAPTQRKASPLPPHTTSTNAFLGNSTPPLERKEPPKKASTFDFDSDSDTEDEFIENAYAESPVAAPTFEPVETAGAGKPSYAALSQVAGRNGIRSPSPELVPVANSPSNEDPASGNSNKIVDQAKGLANHFLGGWKHTNE